MGTFSASTMRHSASPSFASKIGPSNIDLSVIRLRQTDQFISICSHQSSIWWFVVWSRVWFCSDSCWVYVVWSWWCYNILYLQIRKHLSCGKSNVCFHPNYIFERCLLDKCQLIFSPFHGSPAYPPTFSPSVDLPPSTPSPPTPHHCEVYSKMMFEIGPYEK